MASYEIPLNAQAQTFSIQLGGQTYQIYMRWNSFSNIWVLDILDNAGNPLVQAIPLVTGTDLLAPYPDLQFGGTLTVVTDGDITAVPTFNNIGLSSHVIFTTP
jgi:hypothetical protein